MKEMVVSQTFQKGDRKITLYRKGKYLRGSLVDRMEIARKVEFKNGGKPVKTRWTNNPRVFIPKKQFPRLKDILRDDMKTEIDLLEARGWKKTEVE